MYGTEQLIQQLEEKTGHSLNSYRLTEIGGGDINRAYHLIAASVSWFVKLNQPHLLPMFEAEAAGLQELAATQTVRVPPMIAYGATESYAYLVLEHIELKPKNPQALRLFAQQLASLHQQKQPFYGWTRDNTIGSTPQYNGHYQDWGKFWQEQRLGVQLKLAAHKGYIGKLQITGEKLQIKLGDLFENYTPQPSLLHGDLWSGNMAADSQNQPVMFDPASYYGDREADIAMTELFGGFGRDFYAVYQEYYPLDSGYRVRKTLYNLYHILNHLNLFGRGYLHQAESMIDELLAEL